MIDIQQVSFAYRGSFRDLFKRHKGGKSDVFHDLSLQIPSGTICGLLGQNGVGKSTLLYMIMGMLRPQKGEILIDGRKSIKQGYEMLNDIFIVGEDFPLPSTTIRNYARRLGAFYSGYSEQSFNERLEEFQLDGDMRMKNLSMGQRKKAYISLALAMNTRYLLMDEPTNGLDITSKALFKKALIRQMSDDKTIVISTHQVHDVEKLLDKVVILDNGKVTFDESTCDIASQFTFELQMPSSPMDGVIYHKKMANGNIVMRRKGQDEEETDINLELLYNAVAKGKLLSSQEKPAWKQVKSLTAQGETAISQEQN